MKRERFTTTADGAVGLGARCLAGDIHIASGAAARAADEILTAAVSDLYTRDLTQAVGEGTLDIVRMQQWLTGISATRGLDGPNDGFDVAAGFRPAWEA